MNFLKRSFLSVKARKGKSLLQVFVFSVICVLVLAGLSIQTAAEKSSDLARQKLGADVTLQVDMEKMREKMQAQQSNGERRRFQPTPIPVETAEELTSYEHIKGYNFYSSTTALASNFEPITNEDTETIENSINTETEGSGGRIPGGKAQGDISLQGVTFTDSTSEFMDGTASIIEGEQITEEDRGKNVTLIEQTLAEENELKVGDTISITNPRDESVVMDLQIKGIYKTSSTGAEQGMDITAMIPYNKLYVPFTASATLKGSEYEGTIDSAIYYIDNPADMESFVVQAREKSSIDFEIFKLDKDDQLYQQIGRASCRERV